MKSITKKLKSDNSRYGGRIKIYPDILLSAARNNKGGAIRLWFLAKHFNNRHYEGSGLIPRKEFRRWIIKGLKWKAGTYDRYLHEAQKLGVINISGQVYKLAGWHKGAAAAGIYHIGYDELIPLDQFAGKKWLAYSYAAFVKQLQNGKPRPISAVRLSELTGIPIRTIYHYDNITGINKRANYAHHPKNTTADQYAEAVLKDGLNMFVDRNNRALQRLPSTRTVPNKAAQTKTKTITKEGKQVKRRVYGMRKTINKRLNAMADFSIMGKVQHRDKIYIDGDTEQAKNNAERKLISRYKKLDRQDKPAPKYIYRFLKVDRSAGVYLAI